VLSERAELGVTFWGVGVDLDRLALEQPPREEQQPSVADIQLIELALKLAQVVLQKTATRPPAAAACRSFRA